MMRIERSWLRRVGGSPIPKGYGLAYAKYSRAVEVYYPIPVNYIVRYTRVFYWRFLRAFYWVGLIDVEANESFSWVDFFRIKTH